MALFFKTTSLPFGSIATQSLLSIAVPWDKPYNFPETKIVLKYILQNVGCRMSPLLNNFFQRTIFVNIFLLITLKISVGCSKVPSH